MRTFNPRDSEFLKFLLSFTKEIVIVISLKDKLSYLDEFVSFSEPFLKSKRIVIEFDKVCMHETYYTDIYNYRGSDEKWAMLSLNLVGESINLETLCLKFKPTKLVFKRVDFKSEHSFSKIGKNMETMTFESIKEIEMIQCYRLQNFPHELFKEMKTFEVKNCTLDSLMSIFAPDS